MITVKKPEAVWADEQRFGPFDGALIVMNIGSDDPAGEILPEHYMKSLQEAVSKAHTKGWAVVYAFDSERGVAPPLFELDAIHGMDFSRLMHDVCGLAKAEFDADPDARMSQFVSMTDRLFSHDAFSFASYGCEITGRCFIDSTQAIVPVTQIQPK